MKKMRLISLLCALILTIGCFSAFPVFATDTADEGKVWAEGDSLTDKDNMPTYLLNNSNFKAFYEKAVEITLDDSQGWICGNFKLTEDIVINEGDAEEWSRGENIPAKNYINGIALEHASVFDGQGHTISGIYMNVTLDESVHSNWMYDTKGLFRTLGSSATIQNLGIVNSYYEANSPYSSLNLGAIAGRSWGTITNCYVDAILVLGGLKSDLSGPEEKPKAAVGGIVGSTNQNFNKIYNCVFAGTILESAGATGGIVGEVGQGVLDLGDCLNVGSISSTYSNNVGGILGNNNDIAAFINSSLSLRAVSAKKGVSNSLVGSDGSSKIAVSKCTAKDVIASDNWTCEAGFIPNPSTVNKIEIASLLDSADLGLATDITSVRVSDTNAGLRFETTVGNSELLAIAQNAGATVEVKTYITAAKYFKGDNALTSFTKEALETANKTFVTVNATPGIYLRTAEDDGYNAFAGSVVNINDKTMDYIAVGYVKINYGDDVYEFYANYDLEAAANISDVAKASLADVSETKTWLYKNEITDANGATVYSIYNSAQYDMVKTLVAE